MSDAGHFARVGVQIRPTMRRLSEFDGADCAGGTRNTLIEDVVRPSLAGPGIDSQASASSTACNRPRREFPASARTAASRRT